MTGYLGATEGEVLINGHDILKEPEEAKKQIGYLPELPPLYMEQFDSIFNVEASIKADTAYYYDKERLWKLIGNVDIQNRKGERFNTELLYWNEATQKVYSDKFIRIQQPDRIITGHGFDSNQQMTIYTIRNIEGIFYVDEEASSGPPQPETKALPDSVNKDTAK